MVRIGLLLHSACPTQPAPIDPTENQGHTKTLVINQHGVEYCEMSMEWYTMRWVCVCSHVPVLLSPSRQPLTELRSGQQLADLLWSSQQRAWTHLGLAASDPADTNTVVAQVCDGCPHPADANSPRRKRHAANPHEGSPASSPSSRRWSGDRWHWGASGSGHRGHRQARRNTRHKVENQDGKPPTGY